jgi:hypothetical protein
LVYIGDVNAEEGLDKIILSLLGLYDILFVNKMIELEELSKGDL